MMSCKIAVVYAKMMNDATCMQVGDSSFFVAMKCHCAKMFSLVMMLQLHLFENEATIFF